MRHSPVFLFAGLLVFGVSTYASADVQVAMQGGHITLIAKDATVRQILAEWARVGQTRIVNAERIPGGPLTLELVNVPERQALEVLLRSVSGYLAAQRASTAGANTSMFDRIIIMPTSVQPAPVVPNSPPPAFAQPTLVQEQPAPSETDDNSGPPNQAPTPQYRRPAFVFPPAQGINGGQAPEQPAPVPAETQPTPAPSPFAPYPGAPTTVGAPAGVAAPGMVVPSPQPPAGVPPGQPQR